MKKIFFVILFSGPGLIAFASHIVGGEMTYQYLGPGTAPNTKSYKVTLKLFRDENCSNCAAIPGSVFIGVFSNDNGNEYLGPLDIQKNSEDDVPIAPFPPCITNAPSLIYHVAYYIFTLELPANNKGYTVSYQTCCRVNPLENVFNTTGVNGTGSTYTCSIPSIIDNSAVFNTSVDVICARKPFTFNFDAVDPDGDSLLYVFTEALDGGVAVDSKNINPSQ
ncbi:MAG: hypothetical protein H0W12_01205, partial [Chitinophagaceae bacterium]|nr:hypothetical protein [Chitinophagaceae bacterium]